MIEAHCTPPTAPHPLIPRRACPRRCLSSRGCMRGPTGPPRQIRKRSLPSRNSNRRTSCLHASRRVDEQPAHMRTHARARVHARARARASAHVLARPPLARDGWLGLRRACRSPLCTQALPGISGAGGANLGAHGATGATGATGASGGSRPAGAGRGDFIHISNTPRSVKGAEMQEMAEIDELLQEYGL